MSGVIVRANIPEIKKKFDEACEFAEKAICEQIINDTRSMVPTESFMHT